MAVNRFLEENLKNNSFLDYVIAQGLQGNHILFDNETIRRAFAKGNGELASLGVERVREVREALRDIFSIPGTEDKRDYIQHLPEEVKHILVFLYFQILEKNILSSKNRLQ
jgi:hypothetical protein